MAGGNPAKVQVAILNTCFRDLFSLHQFCPALGLAVLCLSLLVSANFRSLPLQNLPLALSFGPEQRVVNNQELSGVEH